MPRDRTKAALFLLTGLLALGLLALAWAVGADSSDAQQGAMYNCPQAGKWAISVWGGDDDSDTGQALAACGVGAVDLAYYLEPATNSWRGYSEGQPQISKLLTVDNMQGVIARGSAAAVPAASLAIPGATYTGTTSQDKLIEFEVSADGLTIRRVRYRITGTEPGGGTCDRLTTSTIDPLTVDTSIADDSFSIAYTLFDMSGQFGTQGQATGELTVHEPWSDGALPCNAGPLTWTATASSATPVPTPTPAPGPGQLATCPQPGKWAISVWTGDDGTDTGQALATCGAGVVDFAYHLDPATNSWQGYFDGQPQISKLLTLNNMQGVIAHGAVGAPPPSPTLAATPAATPTPVATPAPTSTPAPGTT